MKRRGSESNWESCQYMVLYTSTAQPPRCTHFPSYSYKPYSCKLCGLITPVSNRKGLTADKGGIEITSDPAASGSGKVQFIVDRLRELFILRFHIVNKGPNCIHFTYYTALHKIRCFILEDERRVTRACPLFLCPGETTN